MRVHQVLAGAGPHDAVTAQALAFRARFRDWGWDGADHATFFAPGLDGKVQPRERLDPAPDDLLVLHHSAVMPRLPELLELPSRKLLVYHNITPARWLWDVAPGLAVQCAIGREQLPLLVAGVQGCVGVSQFNAAELTAAGAADPKVVPLLLELDRLGEPSRQPPSGSEQILFVGRLSPHKRQDAVIRAFSLLRGAHAPDARLTLVGEPVTPAYGEHLRELAEDLAPGAVTFEQGLDNSELGRRYRNAHAFLCLSEHEGFCLPLIEALQFGVPVVARRAGAVPETVGGAALLADSGDDAAVIAELVRLVLRDETLRRELVARGAERVRAYAPDRTAAALREAIEAVAQ